MRVYQVAELWAKWLLMWLKYSLHLLKEGERCEKDSINYNFCFPIIKSDSLPKHHLISYKQQESVKALKATYNGNYITSDRAWYALLEHAERNAIKVSETPIEVFYNNPNFGGDELQWNAEIFMPLIDQE